MFKGKQAGRSHRNPAIPADVISDELYDVIHAQRCFEECSSQLVKLSKRYEDCIQELNRARLKLREELLSLPLFKTRKSDTNPEKQNFDERIDQFRRSADLLVEQGKNLKENYHGATHDPVRRYMKMFPSINEKVKTHERLAMDYVKARERYDKALKSTTSDPGKRDKAAAQSDAALHSWENSNDVIPEELPELYDARTRFLDPSLTTMVAAHIRYLEAVVEMLSAICHDHEVKMTDEDYQAQIEGLFEDLGKLSITGE
eukprot:TRINITY_DN7503_c0_g1_i1.p1 TRINITY_DN7503_c0_g1~~TRINITY_DN7503_c0_g1_i1.p1  ORF type:complete len:259 (+),score=67.69 TRINITY_DN7503_c0_g1_i1:121-897(+)